MLTPDGKVLWRRSPPAAGQASWEAAPVVAGGRVLAAFVRADAGKLVHSVACYDDRGDRPAWVADVCESPGTSPADGRTRHEPLTLAGRNVVFCSHAGVVAAVNARTGKPAWALRYPPAAARPYPVRRDTSPPVAADGRVFVAPADADHVYALDADTGRLVWDDGPLEVDHLIGAAGGKVVAAIAGPHRGVRGYDAATGSRDAPAGWANHDAPRLGAFGRGLLTSDLVLWPTAEGVYPLSLADGTVARPPLRGPHGNLAYADGVLLVATPREVWGFVQPGGPSDTPVSPPPAVPFAEAVPARPRPPLLPIVKLPATAVPIELAAAAPGSVRLPDAHHMTGDRWKLDALKRPRLAAFPIAAAPRFAPPVYRDATRVVARTTAGRRLTIDADRGTVIDDSPTSRRPWVAPPAPAGELLLVGDGPGVVTAFDPRTGAVAWRHDAGREPSLSGDAAQAITVEGAAFVAVTRNHGVEIDRLDPVTGRRLWAAGPSLMASGPIDLSAADADAERVFVPLADRLVALRTDTGRELWDAPLPAGCRVAAAQNVVIAYSAEAVSGEPPAGVGERLGWSWLGRPDPRRLLGLAATGIEAWRDRTAVLLLFDPATGKLQQRLNLPGRGPAVAVRVAADGVTVTAGAAAYRLN